MKTQNKRALLIGNTTYQDHLLGQLTAPELDITALARVLEQPTLGQFKTTLRLNETSHELMVLIEQLLTEATPDETILLYFSGHGHRAERTRKLYLAVQNTTLATPISTALPIETINQLMSNCRAKRKILILDCCYSGAFANSLLAKGDDQLEIRQHIEGEGYITLTSSSAFQLSYEPKDGTLTTTDIITKSLFTHYIVEAIETGNAVPVYQDNVDIRSIFQYVTLKLTAHDVRQTPKIFGINERGNIPITLNPRWDGTTVETSPVSMSTNGFAELPKSILIPIVTDNVRDMRLIKTFEPVAGKISSLSFSTTTNNILAYAVNRGNQTHVQVADITYGQEQLKEKLMWGKEGAINDLIFSHDGTHIVGAGLAYKEVGYGPQGPVVRVDGHIRFWDVTTMHPAGQLSIQDIEKLKTITQTADGTYIAGDFDGHLIQFKNSWDWTFIDYKTNAKINDIATSPDGNWLAIGFGGFELTRQVVVILAVAKTVQSAMRAFKKGATILDLRTNRVVEHLDEHKSQVTNVVFSHDGQFLLTTSSDGDLYVWRTTDWSIVKKFSDNITTMNSVRFTADDGMIVVASQTGSFHFIRVGTWNKFQLDSSQLSPKKVRKITLSNDGSKVATAMDDNSIRIWGIVRIGTDE